MGHKKVLNPVVGQVVYEPFAPQKVGVIRKVTDKKNKWNMIDHFVTVEWITTKGETSIQTDIDAGHLNDLEWLIADHQKKLNTHLTSLKRAQTLLAVKK